VKPPVVHSELQALWEAPLAADEFNRRVAQAIDELDGEEGENLAALISWFQRRYPTARERFRYARRKYRELTRVR
jgi:hypothetical protein